MLYLTEKQWNIRAKTIETKNLKKYHTTPYWLTIERELSGCIIEMQNRIGEPIRVIDENKYKELRKYCMSEKFVLRKD